MIKITNDVSIYEGDCLDVMKQFPDNSFDTLITDPPAGIHFMAKQWDDLSGYQDRTERGQVVMESLKPLVELKVIQDWEAGFLLFTVDWAYSVLRVLKPGASGLVWSIPRTNDLTQFGLRLAGFRVVDSIAHLFGTGFPKSLDISKSMDKAQGAEREVVGEYKHPDGKPRNWAEHNKSNGEIAYGHNEGMERNITAPATPEAQLWDGWGTSLKPAHEDWILVYKPCEGTYVENALKWGVAGLNIDGARVPVGDGESVTINRWDDGAKPFGGGAGHPYSGSKEVDGRWPANITHDGSPEVVENFPETGASSGGRIGKKDASDVNIAPAGNYVAGDPGFGDRGSAARFFYSAKANKAEREAGLDDIEEDYKPAAHFRPNHFEKAQEGDDGNPYGRWGKIKNNHPTVKSINLMKYLCELTKTPTGGVVIDPFLGSGSTAIGCLLTDRGCVGIDRESKYIEISKRRLKFWAKWAGEGYRDVDQILGVYKSEKEQQEKLEEAGLSQNTLF